MVTEILVSQAVEDGRALLTALRRGRFEVTAAAWLHHAELDRWQLNLVAPMATDDVREAYGRVYDILWPLRLAEVGYDSVRMVRPDEPLGKALQTLTKRWADRVPRSSTRYHSSDLALLGYDDALIYPPAGQMTPADVARVVADIVSGGELDRADSGIHPLVTAEYEGRELRLKPTGIRRDPATRELVVEHESPPGSGQIATLPADKFTDIRLQ